DVRVRRDQVVGWIEIDPSEIETVNRQPGVRGIRAAKALLAGGIVRAQVAADIASRQPQRAQTGNLQMREILTDAAPQVKDLVQRRVDGGGLAVVAKVGVDAFGQLADCGEQRPTRRERRGRVGSQIRMALDIGRVKEELACFQTGGREVDL